jgi:hypothetical protein
LGKQKKTMPQMLQSSYKGNEESWQFGFYSMVGIGNILVNNGG